LKIKLDENFGLAAVRILREAGHDVATVFDQNLAGSIDHDLIHH
jgi:hypothetical protein